MPDILSGTEDADHGRTPERERSTYPGPKLRQKLIVSCIFAPLSRMPLPTNPV